MITWLDVASSLTSSWSARISAASSGFRRGAAGGGGGGGARLRSPTSEWIAASDVKTGSDLDASSSAKTRYSTNSSSATAASTIQTDRRRTSGLATRWT